MDYEDEIDDNHDYCDEYDDHDTSENQVTMSKMLIELVKENPILYKKNLKKYNKKSDKDFIWASIGEILIPPKTGIETQKEFYRLRQKFGKERRKILQTQARSGAGTDHIQYKSDWILYDDLLFLVDFIQPRKTSSNYQCYTREKVPSSQTSPLATSKSTHFKPSNTNNLNIRNAGLYESLIDLEGTNDENFSAVDSISTCSSPSLASIKSSTSSNISASTLRTMAANITLKKQTPLPDIPKKRKREAVDEVDTAMLECSKNISLLANTLGTALKTQTSKQLPTSDYTSAVQGMLPSIILGLSKVSEECQMDCLISILSCINKFIKKTDN